MNIILVAPPAAGKGTQAVLLSEKYGLAHISTGDLIRDAIDRNDEQSSELKKIIESGSLVDDDLILKLIKNKISDNKGYILDGFPRNLEQAKKYDQLLKQLNQAITCVLYLNIDDDLAVKRILGRLSCTGCDYVYNVHENKPMIENVCDICGNDLIKRSDDNEETFKLRFKTYIEQTSPLIDYYKEKGILYEVDSSKAKEEVSLQIERIIDSL